MTHGHGNHVALDGVLVVPNIEGDGDSVLYLHGAFVIKPLHFVRFWMWM